jgi:hypothetical protein
MRGFAGSTGATAKDRVYVTLPLYHATGGLCALGAALLNGGSGDDLLIAATTDGSRIDMTGGAGADTFKVAALSADNGALKLNVIVKDLNYQGGDDLDFTQIMKGANAATANDLAYSTPSGTATYSFANGAGFKSTATDIGTDGAEGPDRHAGCDARAGGNDGRGVDLVHRSRIMAAKVASATTRPSTVASPLNFHTLMRRCTFVTLMRSWSPGTTGRRNFALSIDMK